MRDVIQPTFVVELGVLVGIWLTGWGVAFWLIRKEINYVDNSIVTSLLFLALSAILIAAFWPRLAPLADNPTVLPFAVLLLTAVTAIGLYAVCRRYGRRPDGLIARHPEEFYLRLDPRYLVSKSFEVLFQQLVIVELTLLLASTGMSLRSIVLAFLALFGVLHLPMLRIVGRGLGLIYTLAAATLALVFPVLILRVHSGFVYSYAAHWFAYILAGAVAWAHAGRVPQAPLDSSLTPS
jgi:hypothetical protein